MNLRKFLELFQHRRPSSVKARRAVSLGLESLESRVVPSTTPTFQLQANGDLLQIAASGAKSVIDHNVQTFGVVYSATGQQSVIDLHTNGQMMQMDPAGKWSTLGSNIKNAQFFSDQTGHASVEVLGNDGSLKQYNVNTHQWVTIDWSNVTWMQGIADSTGKLREIYWINKYGSLYLAQASAPGSVIHSNTRSAQIFKSPSDLSLLVQDNSGQLWKYQESTKAWTNIWSQNPTWWQSVANSDGSLSKVYWVDSTSQLWSWNAGQKSVIATGVQSVTINAQGTPQITYNVVMAYYIAIGKPAYLGQSISGLEVGPQGDGYQMRFSNGAIYYNTTYGNRVVYGSIYQYWTAQGGFSSSLGMPKVNQHLMTGSTTYLMQEFAKGNLYLVNGTVTTQAPQIPPPPPINGVLSQMTDSALKSLTQTLFQKIGSIGRPQMIAMLQEVESGGTITSTELASLKVILNSSSVLKIPADVLALANKVVNGSTANSTYQGKTLGNLAAGSSSAQMEKLIGKWFYGSDEPTPTDGSGNSNYTYTVAAGTLFGTTGKPHYGDVQQGMIGDCYLLSAMSSLALKNPKAIENLIVDNHDSLTPGNDTYTVRLWNNVGGTWDYVTVDSKLPTNSRGQFVFNGMGRYATDSTNILWASLVEKAVVQAAQDGWMNRPAVSSYNNISSGWPSTALTIFSGSPATENSLTTSVAVVNQFNNSGLVIFNTDVHPTASNLVADHSYVLVSYNSSTGVFTLFNPWGVNGASSSAGYRPGFVTMTWAQIVRNMQSWDS